MSIGFRWALLGLAILATFVFVVSGGYLHRSPHFAYDRVDFDAADTTIAFAAEGIRLTRRSGGPTVTTLGSPHDVLEVDVFGDPEALRRDGYSPVAERTDCSADRNLAIRWHGNVRAILNCSLVSDGTAWLARTDRALASL
jgi:hypothetical protein